MLKQTQSCWNTAKLDKNLQVNLCFLYFNPKDCVAQLGKVLAEKPEEGATNGEVFDREAYLR